MTRAELLTSLLRLAADFDAEDDCYGPLLDAVIKVRRMSKLSPASDRAKLLAEPVGELVAAP